MANGGIIGPPNIPTSTTATGVWQQEEQYEAKVTDTWPERALFTTKSARFDRGSSDYLNKTFSGAGNRTTWTISVWVKRANELSTNSYIIDSGAGNGTSLYFGPEQIEFWDYQSGAYTGRLTTNAVFRDMSAWYHIVAVWDTTNGTAGNRMRLYVNGVEETSFATDTNPSSSQNSILNDGSTSVTIGRSGSIYTNLYMAEVIFIDGQALDPTSFGVTNSDGVWTPIPYSGTFGTNGFNLQFENSAALGTDSSPNGNTFTVNNLTSIDQSTDTPTNNYCVMNALDNYYTGGTFTQGNLQVQMTNQPAHYTSTFGVSTGKWYWEGKMSAGNNSAEYNIVGVAPNVTDQSGYAGALGAPNHGVGLRGNGNVWYNDTQPESGWNTWNQGDIVMIALDLDNNKIFWGTNGTWGKSSDPVTGTNGFSLSGKEGSKSSGFWFPAGCCREISQTNTFQWNFGNAPFSISSGNTDGNSYGNFEYAVPSGYYALNTANLAEFG
jgi:hypothetical protein